LSLSTKHKQRARTNSDEGLYVAAYVAEVIEMKTKTVVAQLMLLLLLVAHVRAQESNEKLEARASLYEPLIAAAAARHKIDPRLLWTIAYLESRFRPTAISYKDGKPCAFGLMQFIGATAARYGLKDPNDAGSALDAAAHYVSDLQQRFGEGGDLILAAYNAGEGTVEAFRDGKSLRLPGGKVINPNGIRTGGVPPYPETRYYVARGRMVYQSLSREGLFLAAERSHSDAWADQSAGKRPGPEASTENSIYALESKEKQGGDRITNSPKNRRTAQFPQSIYVN
jgi:hypothetical protein